MQKGLKKILILIIFSIILTIAGYFLPGYNAYNCYGGREVTFASPFTHFKNLLFYQNLTDLEGCFSEEVIYRISPSFYIFFDLTILLGIYLFIKYIFLNQKISVTTFKLLRIVLFLLMLLLIILGVRFLLLNLLAIGIILWQEGIRI